MRIFDNPNHPQYGPVRRMWVILAQLDVLDDPCYEGWEIELAGKIKRGVLESTAFCMILRGILQ